MSKKRPLSKTIAAFTHIGSSNVIIGAETLILVRFSITKHIKKQNAIMSSVGRMTFLEAVH